MTEEDMARIQTALGIHLPSAYRELILTRFDEMKSLTYEAGGYTHRFLGGMFYDDVDGIIDTNTSEREPEVTVPNWSDEFFIFGTTGDGDYYCLLLDGTPEVWCFEQGTEMRIIFDSLQEFVNDQIDDFLHEKDFWLSDGDWQIHSVEGEIAGKHLHNDQLIGLKLTIEGHWVKHHGPAGSFYRTFMYYHSQTRKTFKILPEEGVDDGLIGIYSLDNETLRICATRHGCSLPTEFKAGENCICVVFKRVKE